MHRFIYLGFLFNTWLFIWYSDKLLDNRLTAQYWHIPQMIFLIGIYLMPVFVAKDRIKYLLQIICYGMIYPLIFNVGLNLYRQLPIQHTGQYDFLTFTQTIAFAVIGIAGIILIESLYPKD